MVIGAFPALGAENPGKGGAPLFTWDLLCLGSWSKSLKTGDDFEAADLFSGGTLFNRGDFSLGLSKPGLSLRVLATDKRLLPLEEDDGKAGFNPGLGLYHAGSGSRFLYGVQSEFGLSARIKNVWLRSAPFMEARSPSSRDLKTEPSAKDRSETYLYLALPPIRGFSAFASAALDEELNPAFAAGLNFDFTGGALLLEGFRTGKKLPPRTASSWFSSAPPLPERDFDIYALGIIFNSPNVAFASDWAYSETFAWGRGIYGNFALRLGYKPWRFSLAGDGAAGRFSDRGGAMAGTGFRMAAKAERFWPRSGLLRFQGTIRSPAPGEAFDRFSFSLYFRPSAPGAAEKRASPHPVRFTRASLGFNRDARNPLKTSDSLDLGGAFNLGFLSSGISFSLHSLSSLEESTLPPLFQLPVFESFESFKVSLQLGWKPGILDLSLSFGYTIRAKKDPVWGFSVNGSVRPGKWGRIGLKIASADLPEKWEYTLSWRFSASN